MFGTSLGFDAEWLGIEEVGSQSLGKRCNVVHGYQITHPSVVKGSSYPVRAVSCYAGHT